MKIDIVGFEGLYYFDDNYNIHSYDKMAGFRHSKSKLLSVGVDKDGYRTVTLSREGIGKIYRIHRLIAQTFIPNPNNLPCVNHKDGNKSNNHPSNLEWCTYSYNTNHAYSNGLIHISDNQRNNGKVQIQNIIKSGKHIHNKPIYSHKDGNTIMWKSTKECAEALGLNRPNITAVLKGRVSQHKGYTFTYVGGDH